MKYIKFIIENFKGVHRVEIDMGKLSSNSGITLVGLNESGKTTLLKAIESIGNHCRLLHKNKSAPLFENGERNTIKPKN